MEGRLAAAVLLALLLATVPVAAHANYVTADPQVSADGTVRVELAVVVTDGFLVLHRDTNGSPGETVGHRAFEGNLQSDYAIGLDEAFWINQTGNFSLWVVLHRDDGDGKFEPQEDPIQQSASGDDIVADRFAVRKSAEGPTNVIAERDHVQETGENVVTLLTVRLGTDGYVVLRANEDSGPGRVVGVKALSAGGHHTVNVTIDEAFYERRPEEFALWAVVHGSDGDGSFNASSDPAVRVGDERVMTRFWVKRTDPIERTPTPRATATDTATRTVHTELTPTETPPGHGGHEHTPEEETDTHSTSEDHAHEHSHSPPSETTVTPGQSGFSGLAATLGVLLAALIARRRR